MGIEYSILHDYYISSLPLEATIILLLVLSPVTLLSKLNRQRLAYPVFTLPMPAGKLYVVNSPDMVQAVQKQSRALSFWEWEAKFTGRLAGLGSGARITLEQSLSGSSDREGLFIDGMKMTQQAVGPGKHMDQMNQIMMNTIGQTIGELGDEKHTPINLWAWTKHIMTLATTDAAYGALNPYRDSELAEAFWLVFTLESVVTILKVSQEFLERYYLLVGQCSALYYCPQRLPRKGTPGYRL